VGSGQSHYRHVARQIRSARRGQADRGVRIDQHRAILGRTPHGERHLVGADPRAGHHRRDLSVMGGGDDEPAIRLEPAHRRGEADPVAGVQVEQQTFEVGADLDVH
jgi:hypothetical protein